MLTQRGLDSETGEEAETRKAGSACEELSMGSRTESQLGRGVGRGAVIGCTGQLGAPSRVHLVCGTWKGCGDPGFWESLEDRGC